LLKDFRDGDFQAWKQGRLELAPHAVAANRLLRGFRQTINVDALGFRIDDPQFFDTRAGIDDSLGTFIEFGGSGGEHFDDEVGSAFDPERSQDGFARVRDEQHVKHIGLRVWEAHLDRSDEDFAEAVFLEVGANAEVNVAGDVLVRLSR
jgi:hypothetical protein